MPLLAVKRRTEGLVYEDETYDGLDLRSMRAFGARFVGCKFTDCKFDLADMRTVRLESCTFTGCSVTKVDLTTSTLDRVGFIGCDLEQTSMAGAYLSDVNFQECRMAYGDTMFQSASVKANVTFDGCNLHGSNLDFRVSEAGALRFKNCNLWGAKAAFGCAFWQSEFDEQTCQRFIAMVARVHPNNDTRIKLMALAGDEYRVVDRVMRTGEKR